MTNERAKEGIYWSASRGRYIHYRPGAQNPDTIDWINDRKPLPADAVRLVPNPAAPQAGDVVMTVPVTIDDDGTITPHDTARMHTAEWWREHGATFTAVPHEGMPERAPDVGDWCTGLSIDGDHEVTGKLERHGEGREAGSSLLDSPFRGLAWVFTHTLRPADTGKESGPQPPTAGVDYCGATHRDYGECFLDVDEVEHEHGHESESGRWSVTVPAVSTDEER